MRLFLVFIALIISAFGLAYEHDNGRPLIVIPEKAVLTVG